MDDLRVAKALDSANGSMAIEFRFSSCSWCMLGPGNPNETPRRAPASGTFLLAEILLELGQELSISPNSEPIPLKVTHVRIIVSDSIFPGTDPTEIIPEPTLATEKFWNKLDGIVLKEVQSRAIGSRAEVSVVKIDLERGQ